MRSNAAPAKKTTDLSMIALSILYFVYWLRGIGYITHIGCKILGKHDRSTTNRYVILTAFDHFTKHDKVLK